MNVKRTFLTDNVLNTNSIFHKHYCYKKALTVYAVRKCGYTHMITHMKSDIAATNIFLHEVVRKKFKNV